MGIGRLSGGSIATFNRLGESFAKPSYNRALSNGSAVSSPMRMGQSELWPGQLAPLVYGVVRALIIVNILRYGLAVNI